MHTIFDVNKGCIIDSSGLVVNATKYGTGARSSTGYNAGKKYFEVECEIKNINANVGLCDANNNLGTTGDPSSASTVICIYLGWYSIVYGSSHRNVYFTQGTSTNPGAVGIAIDFDKNIINYYYNGVLLSSENYKDKIANIGTKLYPFLMNGGTDGVSIQTWNFGLEPFRYPIPKGYKPWDLINHCLYLKDNAAYGIEAQ